MSILQITPSGSSLMCSTKGVRPSVKPWKTPTVNRYYCKDLPWSTTPSHLLLKKKKQIRPNAQPEFP